MENHGENRAPNICILYVYLLWHRKFTGYFVNHFDTCTFTFARQKSALQIKQRKSNFDIDKTFRALKMIAWTFSSHHIEKMTEC